MADSVIILVDDDSDDRFFILEAIKATGIDRKVIEAENGLELLEILQENAAQVGLIILDMNMPKMNGLEVMGYIRSNPSSSDTPVAMISTSPSADLAEKAYQAGVTSFMSKPNTLEEFDELILMLKKRFLT